MLVKNEFDHTVREMIRTDTHQALSFPGTHIKEIDCSQIVLKTGGMAVVTAVFCTVACKMMKWRTLHAKNFRNNLQGNASLIESGFETQIRQNVTIPLTCNTFDSPAWIDATAQEVLTLRHICLLPGLQVCLTY